MAVVGLERAQQRGHQVGTEAGAGHPGTLTGKHAGLPLPPANHTDLAPPLASGAPGLWIGSWLLPLGDTHLQMQLARCSEVGASIIKPLFVHVSGRRETLPPPQTCLEDHWAYAVTLQPGAGPLIKRQTNNQAQRF